MSASLLLLVLTGCGPGDLTVNVDTVPCENIDLDDPPEVDVVVEQDGNITTLSRVPLFKECGATFEPDVLADGAVIEVDELWSAGDGDCCYQAELAIKAENSGAEVEVLWYEGDAAEPLHTIAFSTP
ncbi:MAG: hypothetical protein VX899_02565 [Myxococcota bacterium]|nr:hypothetical protein [Myxococcota bacterium]